MDIHRPTHHSIAVVDVEGYGDPARTYSAAGVPWDRCYHDDSVLTLAPADVPKSVFVEQLPALLVAEWRSTTGCAGPSSGSACGWPSTRVR